MIRSLALGMAAAAAVAIPAAPASAAFERCVSLDVSCQVFTCPPGSHAIVDQGVPDTGPWIVVCAS